MKDGEAELTLCEKRSENPFCLAIPRFADADQRIPVVGVKASLSPYYYDCEVLWLGEGIRYFDLPGLYDNIRLRAVFLPSSLESLPEQDNLGLSWPDVYYRGTEEMWNAADFGKLKRQHKKLVLDWKEAPIGELVG